MDSKIVAVTVATEGQLAGGHLIEDNSKREQIAPRIEFLRARLLWRHISDGAQRGTGTGEMLLVDRGCHGVRRGNLARRTGRGRDLRQPEIQNLGVSALGHEDVRWFDVAVDDA